MVREQIANDLARICQKLGLLSEKVEITHPSNPKFGDYSTNLPLQQQKQGGYKGWQSPEQIAKKIVETLGKLDYLEKTEVISPGFINFFLSKNFLQSQVGQILEKRQSFSTLDIGKGKKARIEFVSANPTGPLHIGNARGGPIGDVIANILEVIGYKVLREYIDNDRGNQVNELGRTLAVMAGFLKTNEGELSYRGEYTNELARKIKAKLSKTSRLSESEIITKAGELGVKLLFEDIINDTAAMGIKFDLIVHESDLQKKAPKILAEFEKKGLLAKKEGALWFAPENEFLKDKDAVVVKSDGSYTYFTADIVYHKEKFESGYDLVVDVFGSNTFGHVPKLKALITVLGFNLSNFKVILYQFVRVKRGSEIIKMSKRAGNFVTAREVLDEVGRDAFRFFMLMHAPSTHMDFDLEQATKQASDNPVYYVQYAHARICSILKKAKTFAEADLTLLNHQAELALIKQLIKLPEILADISENFQVQILPNYALGTATSFHKFYEQCRVISDDKELTAARLGLLRATRIILGQSLKLLGVGAPEKM